MGFERLGELQLLCKPVILETAKGKQNQSAADYSSISSLVETVAQWSSISKHYVLTEQHRGFKQAVQLSAAILGRTRSLSPSALFSS